jgi:hypothetical protein
MSRQIRHYHFMTVERQILHDLVNKTDHTPEDAVQQIVQRTKLAAADAVELGGQCADTADAVVYTAVQHPSSQHPKLVSFFHLLRANNLTNASGEPLRNRLDNELVWKDLPTFGYTFADELHRWGKSRYTLEPAHNCLTDIGPGPGWGDPEDARRVQNAVAFFARLDASIGSDQPEHDFTLIWAPFFLRIAFGQDDEEGYHELSTRLACLWFIHDADKMWRNVPDRKDFTLTQWQNWTMHLKEARIAFEGRQDTVDLVDKALAEIRRVER